MAAMKRALLFALAASLSGCVAYPRGYWTVKEGTANVEDGKPVVIKAVLLKDCQSVTGQDTQTELKTVQTTTDAQGHYRLPMRGMAWQHRNLFSDAGCETHIQMYVCRPVCKEADDIDINVLGK